MSSTNEQVSHAKSTAQLIEPLMESAILQVQGLSKTFDTVEGPTTILHDVNFELRSGKTAAIMGESGSGKTTLLSLLAGFETPNAGTIALCGQQIANKSSDERAAARRDKVGYVFQQFHLLTGLNALDNVILPMTLAGRDDAEEIGRELLAKLGLEKQTESSVTTLSGGEQQRVAIARALIARPQLIFADEPTGNLDEETSDRVADLLFDTCRQQGIALLLVTHDGELASRCDERYLLQHKKLQQL